MDKIKPSRRLYYASGHDEHRDLFVTVELSSGTYGKQEEKVIDNLMEEFYKKYNEEIKELWRNKYGSMESKSK